MTSPLTRKLFCFGMGYTAEAPARRVRVKFEVVGTHKRAMPSAPAVIFDGTQRSSDVAQQLKGATHVLLSIPPSPDGDPALIHHGADLAALGTLKWVGYLSTIGVYGDADGAWVNEDSPINPTSVRGQRRADAEQAWLQFGRAHGKHVQIFRLPGIYGPGRSAIDTMRAGTARRVIKPGLVFNRIHVDDIAQALDLAMHRAEAATVPAYDTFNVVDDEPAPPQDVISYAARLLGMPAPPDIPIEQAKLSEMALSFYRENKRVRNKRLKDVLGWRPAFPTYREGLGDIVARG